MRQKPTRLPYSCQAQFGISGDGEPPAGGVSTVRGMVSVGSHSSMLTITHTAIRALPGSFSGGRSVMANRRCVRLAAWHYAFLGPMENEKGAKPSTVRDETIAGRDRADAGGRAGHDEVARLQAVLLSRGWR